eukprot:TRINITY_DN1957_c0_g1_i11.p1 TRINITY_DN1957_c0_g1~~TRINITY_DN1957_c0_g1_i11.p1  ORF type:complete len:405 (-),score=30.30 TRINITY_DN1957_c0_g1_i11:333-1547(-)
MEEEEDDYSILDAGDNMDEAAAAPSLPLHRTLQQELTEQKIKSFYDSMGKEQPEVLDPNDFVLGKGGHLFLKNDNGELVKLTTKTNASKFLKEGTIRSRLSAANLRRLNIETTSEMRSGTIKALQNALQELPTGSQIQDIPLKDLSKTADELVGEIETSFNETSEETLLKTFHDPPLPMREIEALNHTLQTIRGELTNNLAKLGELDEHINREKQKIAVADDENLGQEFKDRVQQRLKNLIDERAARLEVLSANREQLRSQVERIRETIHRILNENTTLAERIRTLFREQGITIVSVLTAIGFAISSIVLAVTGGSGGSGGTSPSPPSPPSPGDKSWVKKQLDHLANLLKKLAVKAMDALPGILGSIVSWILSAASQVVGFVAEHLWTLALLVIGLLFNQIKSK